MQNNQNSAQKQSKDPKISSNEYVICYSNSQQKWKGNNNGKWTFEENLKFVIYMDLNQSMFRCKKDRSQQNFNLLSDFLETRSPIQCKNHLNLLLNRHKTVKKVILFYKKSVGDEEYSRMVEMEKYYLENESELSENSYQSSQISYAEAQIQTDPVDIEGQIIRHQYELSLWAGLFETQYCQYKYGINFNFKQFNN